MASTTSFTLHLGARRYLDPVKTTAPAGTVPKELWLQNIGIAIEILMPTIALIVCILRGYSRILTKNVGPDDYCILVAMILSIAQAVGSVIYIKIAYVGIHDYEMPPHDMVGPGIWSYINGIVYNPILALVKVSVLVFLLRLASIRPRVKMTIWILISVTVALMIAIFLAVIFVCHPIAFNWDSTITEHRCFDKAIFTLATAGLNIVTDLTTLAIPCWIFRDLRIARKAKIALIAIFALGFVVTIVAIIRLYLFTRMFYSPKPPDPTFRITYVISSVENNLAIMAASGPSLWPLARRCWPALFSSLGLERGYQGDIPDIETATHHDQGGEKASVDSGEKPLSKWRSFDFFRKGFRGDSSASSSKKRQAKRYLAAGAGPGVHASRTIGGSRFILGDIRLGGRPHGHASIRSHTPQESEEEIMTFDGIKRAEACAIPLRK